MIVIPWFSCKMRCSHVYRWRSLRRIGADPRSSFLMGLNIQILVLKQNFVTVKIIRSDNRRWHDRAPAQSLTSPRSPTSRLPTKLTKQTTERATSVEIRHTHAMQPKYILTGSMFIFLCSRLPVSDHSSILLTYNYNTSGVFACDVNMS